MEDGGVGWFGMVVGVIVSVSRAGCRLRSAGRAYPWSWDTLRKRVCSQSSNDDAGADALKVARTFHLSQSSGREVAACDADMVSTRSK